MRVKCIKISPWAFTKVNEEVCMTRKVGDKIEVRKCRLWERIRYRFLNAITLKVGE